MPALLSMKKQSLENDILYMAVRYYFQMNGTNIAHLIHHLQKSK